MTALFRDEKCSQSTDVGQPTKHSNVPDEATKKKTTAAALSSPRAIDPVALRDFPEESEAEGRDRMHSVTEEEIMNHRRRALPAGGTDKEGGEALVAEASERAARASQSHLLTHTELQARANRDARKHQSELAAQEKRKFTKRMAAKKKESWADKFGRASGIRTDNFDAAAYAQIHHRLEEVHRVCSYVF